MRPYCSSLVEKVVSSASASDLDTWTNIADLLKAFSSPRVSLTPATPPHPHPPPSPGADNRTNIEKTSPILRKLRENWTNDYLRESLDALQGEIEGKRTENGFEHAVLRKDLDIRPE
jgi:hypothetical protein